MTMCQYAARGRQAARISRCVPLLLAGLLASGCMAGAAALTDEGLGRAAGAESASAAAARQDVVRELTVQCFWHHDGERMIVGGAPVLHACLLWADRQVDRFGPHVVAY